MPAFAQRRNGITVEARFDDHFPALHHTPARRIDRRLRVLPVQHNAQRHLHVPLRLHWPAHHAERHQRFALPVHRKTWNNGVERTFTARQRVRVFRVKYKTAATVLQADPGIRDHHA
ncbi:hypothetical protein D3C71_1236780 [compost metagenome]